MKEWGLEELQRCWVEIIEEADRWPQRVAGPGEHAYIISADLYRRFFDRGIRFDGDEYAHLDVEPPREITRNWVTHNEPQSGK